MLQTERSGCGPLDFCQVQELRRLARLAVEEAGYLIRDHLLKPRSLSIEAKGTFDFVTNVDRACEGLIVQAIKKGFPDHAIVAEESYINSIGEGPTWIIDPLDGTTNFIHGFPFVAVSVALALNGRIVLGWVLDPIRRELFEAVAGGGAFLNGQQIRVRSHATLDDVLLATGFPFRAHAVLPSYLAAFGEVCKRVSGIRRAGAAALDLAYLAAGRVDGFWEVGLKPWDVAAGMLMIEEAGGRVTDFGGGGTALTSGHIVAGTSCVYPWLQQVLAEHMLPYVTRTGH